MLVTYVLPLWVIIIIIIFIFISEIQKAFMQKVSVSCEKREWKPNCAEIATFFKKIN